MKTLLLRTSLCWLLMLLSQITSAQSMWQRLYGGVGRETNSQLLHLKDGGYLMMGSRANQGGQYNELYLIRTDGQGNQLWIRTHLFPDCEQLTTTAACENNAGQVLLTATTTVGSPGLGNTATTGLLLLLQPNGSVAWSKRTATISSYSVPGYAGTTLADDGNFWVGANDGGISALLRVTATGQELQRIPFANKSISNLFRLPSGLYVSTNALLTRVSESGVPNAETALPANTTSISDIVPLDGDEVLVASNEQLAKVNLVSSVVSWTRAVSQGNLLFHVTKAKRLPNGNLLVYGTEYFSSHTLRPTLAQLDAEGNQLYGPPVGEGGRPVPVREILGSSIGASAAGLFLDDTTGQIVVSGYLRTIEANEPEVFLRAYSSTSLGFITSPSEAQVEPLTAWPNPVSDEDHLTFSATYSRLSQFRLYNMQGGLMRTWPEQASLNGTRLSMKGVPAGVYLLTALNPAGERTTLRVVKN